MRTPSGAPRPSNPSPSAYPSRRTSHAPRDDVHGPCNDVFLSFAAHERLRTFHPRHDFLHHHRLLRPLEHDHSKSGHADVPMRLSAKPKTQSGLRLTPAQHSMRDGPPLSTGYRLMPFKRSKRSDSNVFPDKRRHSSTSLFCAWS